MKNWVTEARVELETGLTRGQIKSRRQRKKWRVGIEYADIDGTLMYDLDAIRARNSTIAARQRANVVVEEVIRTPRLK